MTNQSALHRTVTRASLIVAMLGVGPGCGGRSSIVPGPGGSDGSPGDSRALDQGLWPDSGTPRTCSGLVQKSTVLIELGDTMKAWPRAAFDGEQFAVLWHSQPAIVSSPNGELRFARVDRSGTTSAAAGISLATDNASTAPAFLPQASGYVVVHQPATSSGGAPGLTLRRFDRLGKTQSTATIQRQATRLALALSGPNLALLVGGSNWSPELLLLDSTRAITRSGFIITAQIMDSLWLFARPTGFMAILHSTNANAALHVLDEKLKDMGQQGVGHGALIRAPSFTPTATGYASIYAPSAMQIEVELYNAAGEDLSRTQLQTGVPAPTTTGQTALAFSGRQLAAVYPSAAVGRFFVHLLGADGKPVAKNLSMTNCLTSALDVQAVWGGDRLAVVSRNESASAQTSCICVAIMECL